MESEAIAILNSVDAGGRLAFTLSSFPHVVRAEFDNDMEYRRECILTHLVPLGGFVSHRFAHTKIGYTEAAVVESDGKLSFQLAPILRVPYGRAGLIEFRDFLLSMQEFYRTHAEYRPCVRIANIRNRRKVTCGIISALYWFDRSDKPLHDTQCEAALRRRIDSSAALTSWLRQFALDLNKLGPHSWLSVPSELLFATDADPTRSWRNRPIVGEK